MVRIRWTVLVLAGWLTLSFMPSVTPAEENQTPASAPADNAPPVRRTQRKPVAVERTILTDDGATVATLSNGMTVILKPVHTAPVVAVRCYVRAGGMLEGRWLGCGLSHLLEHLVARDAAHDGAIPSAETSAPAPNSLEAQIGGVSNAYTTLDHTCYHIAAAASKAPLCVDLIAGQMTDFVMTDEDFRREHGVVQREWEMGRDNPQRIFRQATMANAFGSHPAAVPVIGYAEPLANITKGYLLAYHAQRYQPQNMVFTIVGDIDAQAMLARVLENVKEFRRGRADDPILPEVPPLAGVRRMEVSSPATEQTMQEVAFQTISLVHRDLYALDVLSYILTQGQSSRLVKDIVLEKQLATSIDSFSWTPEWGTGVFGFVFRCEPDQADAVEAALLDGLRVVSTDGVREEELARAKRQKIADYVIGQQTMEDIASRLATDYLSTGDVTFSKTYTDRIQAVTTEQVRDVARRYLDFNAMAITRMVPAGAEAQAIEDAHADTKTAVEQFQLDNGLRVVLRPSDAVELVSMVLTTPGGLLLEDRNTNGLGNLTMMLSTRGTAGRTAEDIAAFFDEAGGGFSGTCGNNSFVWQATVLSDRTETALEIFANSILSPTLPEEELEKIRPLVVSAIKSEEEQWIRQLMKFYRRTFFAGRAWQWMTNGRLDVVQNATIAQLRAWHETFLHGSDAVLTVYGDIDPTVLKPRIETLFANLPEGEIALPAETRREIPAAGETHVLKTDTTTAGVIVAAAAPKLTDVDDHLALMLLDTIISGYYMPSGWLHEQLRGRQLVYVVHAYQQTGFVPGAFAVYAGTQPDTAPEVVRMVQENLAKAVDYLPTREELDQAILTITTADALNNQAMSDLAFEAALHEMYGLGVDWPREMEQRLRAITPEQVRDAARAYLAGGHVIVVTTPKPELFDGATLVESIDVPVATPTPKEQP
jgi:zinc protease